MKKEKNAALKGVGIIPNMFHIPWRKVMKLIEIWEKLGKQPLYITQHKDAEIFVKGLSGKYYITGIRDIIHGDGKYLPVITNIEHIKGDCG